MTYIIHGATGAQGAPVLTALQASGKPTTAAVRDTKKLPVDTSSISVDLTDAKGLTDAYLQAEGVFIHLPMGSPADAPAQVQAIVTAVNAARPKRVVISTSGQVVDQPGSPLQAPKDSPIQSLIRDIEQTGVSTAVVAPRLYLENLLLPMIIDPAREEGVLRYPLPADFPVSWSSHLDVAEVIVRLLCTDDITGVVAVGHLPVLRGPDLATAFSSYFGRKISYEGITPDVFGELINPMFGPAADPVVGLYRLLNSQGGNTIRLGNSAQQLLGITPRPLTQWLDDLRLS